MKRVLITGASGFVGANLARRLLREGHELHLLLRRSHQSWRLDEIASHVEVHEADLEDAGRVGGVVRAVRPEWVFHLAAYGAYSSQTGFARMVATNVVGGAALIDACVETGPEVFIQTGSSSEYGYKGHPAVEEEPVQPNSHYAISKAAATHYCQYTARAAGINAIAVRLYSIYGPYEEPTRLVPALLVHALQGSLPPLVSPRIARDFVYVEDAVDAMLELAAAPRIPRGAVYNICTGRQITLERVVNITRQLRAVPAEPVWSSMERRSWDTETWVGSPAALEAATGWVAPTRLEEGLRLTIEWLQSNPEWRRYYTGRILPDLPV